MFEILLYIILENLENIIGSLILGIILKTADSFCNGLEVIVYAELDNSKISQNRIEGRQCLMRKGIIIYILMFMICIFM